MDGIIASANQLAEALRESTLYKDYRRSRIRVAEDPNVSGRLLEFKKKQAALEMKRLQDQPVTFEEEKDISHLYGELRRNETAGHFLACEQAFLDAYRRMQDILCAAIEMDVYLAP